MRASKEAAKPAEVNRGLPSVNETRKKSNLPRIMAIILVVLAIGGGAAYWVYLKVGEQVKSLAKPPKQAEEKPVTKARVFSTPSVPPPVVVESPAPEASVPDTVANAAGTDAPPIPAPLGGIPAKATGSPAPEAHVPAIAVVGNGPSRPAPLRGTSNQSAQVTGFSSPAPATAGRSRYDTPFVINGGVQPSGKVDFPNAGTDIDDTIAAGKQALAAARRGSAPQGMGMMGGGSPSNSGRSDGGKGALTGMLSSTSTPMVRAGMLGNLSLMVRKGTPLECVLQTKIVAEIAGYVKCRLTSPLYSADGKVILADRGSEAIGEQSGTMKQGQTRLYVLWSEIMTPDGVTIPIDSPGADALGASGLDGHVENHWAKRIGASLMLSLIDDAFAYEIAKESAQNGATAATGGTFQGTQQQGQRIAEKVLDSTINIPPTLYKHQGEKISIIIARHLDFSSVYSLEAK